MKNIHIIVILTFIFIISCRDRKSNQIQQNSKVQNKTILDTLNKEKINNLIQQNEIKNDTLLLVEILNKFYDNNDYYISLSYKNEYSDSLNKIIMKAHGEKIFENSLESRYKISANKAVRYFSTNGLDTLVIIDKDQKVIDTITRKNYEFYQGTIESQYVATYEFPNNLVDSMIAISTNVKDLKLNLTPQPYTSSRYKDIILRDNSFDYDKIYSHSTIINKSDTISILSFRNYSNYKNHLYLIKNGKLMDSIINDYMAVSSLRAVPLATKYEFTYLYTGFKPDTDWIWTGLMGIDLVNWKFNLYENNRIKR